MIGCLMVLVLSTATAFEAAAQNKVVVIPLSGNEPTGNATVDDVLKDKTFSNSSDTGLTGKRPPAPVEKTGQTVTSWIGDDGALQKGVPLPTPRFFEHTSNLVDQDVVTDNLTGLSWQKIETTDQQWIQALGYCNTLVHLTGSGPFYHRWDDWRLPNVKELHSLINYNYYDPALSNSAGTGQAINGDPFYYNSPITSPYWSSTTDVRPGDVMYWYVHLYSGDQGSAVAASTLYSVRCVHD